MCAYVCVCGCVGVWVCGCVCVCTHWPGLEAANGAEAATGGLEAEGRYYYSIASKSIWVEDLRGARLFAGLVKRFSMKRALWVYPPWLQTQNSCW